MGNYFDQFWCNKILVLLWEGPKHFFFVLLGLPRIWICMCYPHVRFVCNVNNKQRWPRKLPIIILLHLGLIIFRFHFGKIRNFLIFMIPRPSGRVHEFQNQLFWTFEFWIAQFFYRDPICPGFSTWVGIPCMKLKESIETYRNI